MRRARWAMTVAVAMGCATPAPVPARHELDFKSELSRFGEWIVVRPYGRVWHPHARVVGTPFVPYSSGGRWVAGPTGWEFQSRWPWGEFTFHHGRWFMGQDLGWVWWPDQTRGPAWVEWRFGGGYVGWAPKAPPPPVNSTLAPEPQRWAFVKARQFTQNEVETYLLPTDEVNRVLSLADPLPAASADRGPDVEQVREQGGLTADGGVPDLTPPVEPPQLAAPEPPKDERPPPPPPKKRKSKKGH